MGDLKDKKWKKGGRYYCTNGLYTINWNDLHQFSLFWKKNFVTSGTRAKCLEAYKNHKPVELQTNKEWLEDYNGKPE